MQTCLLAAGVLSVLAVAHPATVHAQAGAGLGRPVEAGSAPAPPPRIHPREGLQRVRRLRLTGESDAALSLAEELVSSPTSLGALGPRELRELAREVRRLENPVWDGGWVVGGIVGLALGGVGAFSTFVAYVLASISTPGALDQTTQTSLLAGAIGSGVALLSGLALLFVHWATNSWDPEYRDYEHRQRQVEVTLRDASRGVLLRWR